MTCLRKLIITIFPQQQRLSEQSFRILITFTRFICFTGNRITFTGARKSELLRRIWPKSDYFYAKLFALRGRRANIFGQIFLQKLICQIFVKKSARIYSQAVPVKQIILRKSNRFLAQNALVIHFYEFS